MSAAAGAGGGGGADSLCGRGRRAAGSKAAGAAGPASAEDVEVRLAHVAMAVMALWARDALCPSLYGNLMSCQHRFKGRQ